MDPPTGFLCSVHVLTDEQHNSMAGNAAVLSQAVHLLVSFCLQKSEILCVCHDSHFPCLVMKAEQHCASVVQPANKMWNEEDKDCCLQPDQINPGIQQSSFWKVSRTNFACWEKESHSYKVLAAIPCIHCTQEYHALDIRGASSATLKGIARSDEGCHPVPTSHPCNPPSG